MAIDKKVPLQPTNTNSTKTIEETYQKVTQLEHILLRPDTYIGSTEKQTQTIWIYENDKMVNRPTTYVPGLYKIFDEILVNAADNKQRDPKMDTIKVCIDAEENCISVYNNGDGVPVEIHQEEKVYVPEMIFGHLLTSSNYNDMEKKTTGGRNGYGAKLTNIFSTEFVIETADGKRFKKYKQVFTDNMTNKTQPNITKCKDNENWTKVTFKPDLPKFNMTCLEEDVVALMKKRVIDIAGCLGKTVKVELNGQRVPVKSFSNYCELYLTSAEERTAEPLPRFSLKVNDRWEVLVSISDGHFQQVSFVNSIATIKGGQHVDHVTTQITSYLLNQIKRKNKNANLKAQTVKNYIWIFVNALIDNPAFDSQTKETLTTRPASFGSKCELPPDFLKKVEKSGILDTLNSWEKFQQNKELKKTDGSKRGRVSGVPKLMDANNAGGKESANCTLILTEGDSAKSLAVAGTSVVSRDYYGVFPLRGKLLNVREATHKQIMENTEIEAIKKILGLKTGMVYSDQKSMSKLRYGHLMIMTDQDHDGSHIKGLLINFIHSFWPSLLKIPSFLVEFITPIVKATKKNETLAFYTIPEYETWKESLGKNARNWTVKYYKGLGTSTASEGEEYFRNLKKHKIDFTWEDDEDEEAIEMAFSKKKIEARKNWLRNFEPGTYLDQKQKLIKYSDFVNKELILFSLADLERSIPSMVDGLKPGQRKILFCAFKKNLVAQAKVAQFSGFVSEHSAYHHGEQSLASTIVGMAQDFVGSNNINLLVPAGQFGTRLQGGKDAASSRYIFTCLSPITRFVFPKDDDGILKYLNDDGLSIEPFWYVPVIPMVLVNGSEGIGTGWSSYIPNYNPRDIIANVRRMLNGEALVPMHPWYRGFKGTIEKSGAKEGGASYTIYGIIEEVDEKTLRIVELPIRKWMNDYKEFLESIVIGNEKNKDPFIEEYLDHCDTGSVSYEIIMSEKNLDMAKQEGLIKKFKLTTSISTSNMHLFDPQGKIKKYDTPEQILEEFFQLRLEFYEKRKILLVKNLRHRLLILDNKVRFIREVVKGEIIVSNRKRLDLFQELHQKGYSPNPEKSNSTGVVVAGTTYEVDENEENPEVDGSQKTPEVVESSDVQAIDYEYLISMPISSLTKEKIEQLQAERDKLEKGVVDLENTTSRSIWMKDLGALEAKLEEQDKKDAEAAGRRLKDREKNLKREGKVSRPNQRKPKPKKTKNSSPTESGAVTFNSTSEAGDVGAAKPKAGGGLRKAPAKMEKTVLIDSDDDAVDDLEERLAKYNLDSSPDQSAAMEIIPEGEVTVILESDEEFVAGLKEGKKKGGRKPAATKAAKPAVVTKAAKPAAVPRKRGPAANKLPLSQTLTVQGTGTSPDKKVRKLRPSPFNKKSSSVLGRMSSLQLEEKSSGSSSASGTTPDGENEAVDAKPRPQRANRGAVRYVVSDSEPDDDVDDDDEFETSDSDASLE